MASGRPSTPEIVGLVPARGGSKGVPRKNIKLLAGEPLIAYTIREALRSRHVSRVIVSTDDEEIAAVAGRCGAEVPFLRPPELALDDVTDLPVFRHCLRWLDENEGYRPEVVAHLRPTSPLRTAEHIDRCVELLLDSPDADSVRSVCPAAKHPLKMWRIEGRTLVPFVPPETSGIPEVYNMPRQSLPGAYVQNGAVDAIRTRTILAGSMSGSVILGFVMDEDDSVSIDGPLDWALAEVVMARRREATERAEAARGRGRRNG